MLSLHKQRWVSEPTFSALERGCGITIESSGFAKLSQVSVVFKKKPQQTTTAVLGYSCYRRK